MVLPIRGMPRPQSQERLGVRGGLPLEPEPSPRKLWLTQSILGEEWQRGTQRRPSSGCTALSPRPRAAWFLSGGQTPMALWVCGALRVMKVGSCYEAAKHGSTRPSMFAGGGGVAGISWRVTPAWLIGKKEIRPTWEFLSVLPFPSSCSLCNAPDHLLCKLQGNHPEHHAQQSAGIWHTVGLTNAGPLLLPPQHAQGV